MRRLGFTLSWSQTVVALCFASSLIGAPASAQYAVGHRSFGAGTSFGGGVAKLDLDFTDVDDSNIAFLLPTLELKLFLWDNLSLDVSLPVTNMAANNALRDHFLVAGEAYLNFHPNAPAPIELFVAPGLGLSYMFDETTIEGRTVNEEAWAFYVPARIGVELNSSRRTFSVIIAARPFFTLLHGAKGDINPGGGMLVEVALMGYSTHFRGDRY